MLISRRVVQERLTAFTLQDQAACHVQLGLVDLGVHLVEHAVGRQRQLQILGQMQSIG
ncbi:hypothetical protein D3C72_1958710 [compost metagenome]